MPDFDVSVLFEDFSACPLQKEFPKFKYPWEIVAKLDSLAKIPKSQISKSATIHKSVVITGKVIIGKNVEIDPFVVIEGPCIIGDNSAVRPHAWIRPATVIGNDCIVGHGVELKNSLLFNNSKIGTNCFVGDSILGKGARIGSGTILGNRRFDQKAVPIRVGGKEFDSGTDKFGAIVGDYSRLGTNCSTSPGTIIGKHTWVSGNALLKGFIPNNKLLKVKAEYEYVDKDSFELSATDMKGKV